MSAFWRGHFGAAAGSCCQSGLCALERACWRRCGVPWKVLLRALVSERRVRFGAGMLVPRVTVNRSSLRLDLSTEHHIFCQHTTLIILGDLLFGEC